MAVLDLGMGVSTAGGVEKAAGQLSPCGQRPCTLQFKLSCHGPQDFCAFILAYLNAVHLILFFQGCRQDQGRNSLTFNIIVVFIFEGTI